VGVVEHIRDYGFVDPTFTVGNSTILDMDFKADLFNTIPERVVFGWP